MVEYRIDRRSGIATYLQIVQQTKQALRLGLLEPGDRLPPTRRAYRAGRRRARPGRGGAGARAVGDPPGEQHVAGRVDDVPGCAP
ncbi:hypothetical protein ACIG63_26645 [Streptomyces antimycoticus]|uniref:hypothetical protein n=1 Tax=Streptomyces violaceusniger group TaxID=2839105 RepID=UPI000ADE87F7